MKPREKDVPHVTETYEVCVLSDSVNLILQLDHEKVLAEFINCDVSVCIKTHWTIKKDLFAKIKLSAIIISNICQLLSVPLFNTLENSC